MAAFISQPDEGYSEDPLNPSFSGAQDASSSGTSGRTPAHEELTAILQRRVPSLTNDEKMELAMTIINNMPTSGVVELVKRMHPRLYIDFIQYLPPEVCLKILGYLDPVALIRVAGSCRAWHDLALDRKLWEQLYHLEGWKADYEAIQRHEDSLNERHKNYTLHRVRSSEDGHTYKKRAISEDNDLEMTDVDRPLKTEESVTGNSIFGSPASSFTGFGRNSATPTPVDVDMDRSSGSKSRSADRVDSKGKGIASPLHQSTLVGEDSLPSMVPTNACDGRPPGVPESKLWSWDASSSKYRLNWRYLYTMRRRLERNWELGRYSNFQLPRPDRPQDGHTECIYTLQYDKEYLVSGSRDRTIRIWSLINYKLLRKPLEGHNGSVLCLQFDADKDEDLIVSGSSDSDVILWRFSTGQMIQRLSHAHTESVLNVKFDKRILVTCSKDKSIKIFNRRPLKYGDPGYGDSDIIYPVPTHVRDYGYSNPMDDLPVKPPYTMIGVLDGHGAAVNAVQICDNEIVSASGDRNIKVWDWAKQVCIRTVVGHSKGIACVQYDGRRIVSGSSDNEVKVFDRFTGLEVASLRAHNNLVRTVQAGFGDLPYSAEEDKLEAKRVDQKYFEAVQKGEVSPYGEQGSSSRRSRPRNAGSSKPEDITAYGANIPPGGGGGKYARIVSGSYDQTIIIWRRDKEGVWKDVHRLRQEEGAAAAQVAWRAASEAKAQAQARTSIDQVRASIDQPIIATITPESAQSFIHMIEITVPQGPQHLRSALMEYPTMLAYTSHIQATIAREPNPRTRTELRQILQAASLEIQFTQARARAAATAAATREAQPLAPATLPSLELDDSAPGGFDLTQIDFSAPPFRPSEAPAVDVERPARRHYIAHTTTANLESMRTTSAPTNIPQRSVTPGATQTPSPAVQGHLLIQGQNQTQGQARSSSQPPANAQPTQPGAPVQTQATPVPVQGAQNPVPDADGGAAAHHPHIANADNGPARVFKLQYDAHRIICCSQTTVIVGWDFTNGDEELREVARLCLFGSVD
ncbi:F-box/WD repeat-containing protein 1A [Colletotrichum sp. SAR 10_99]|nr:F-box/WD repeat-containing protein 1A [Colletotrichum sp. SAR 10_99]